MTTYPTKPETLNRTTVEATYSIKAHDQLTGLAGSLANRGKLLVAEVPYFGPIPGNSQTLWVEIEDTFERDGVKYATCRGLGTHRMFKDWNSSIGRWQPVTTKDYPARLLNHIAVLENGEYTYLGEYRGDDGRLPTVQRAEHRQMSAAEKEAMAVMLPKEVK